MTGHPTFLDQPRLERWAGRFRRYHRGSTLAWDEDLAHFVSLHDLDSWTYAQLQRLVEAELVAAGAAVFT